MNGNKFCFVTKMQEAVQMICAASCVFVKMSLREIFFKCFGFREGNILV